MNENEITDAAAQDQEDYDSMVEATVDRQIFTEIDNARSTTSD